MFSGGSRVRSISCFFAALIVCFGIQKERKRIASYRPVTADQPIRAVIHRESPTGSPTRISTKGQPPRKELLGKFFTSVTTAFVRQKRTEDKAAPFKEVEDDKATITETLDAELVAKFHSTLPHPGTAPLLGPKKMVVTTKKKGVKKKIVKTTMKTVKKKIIKKTMKTVKKKGTQKKKITTKAKVTAKEDPQQETMDRDETSTNGTTTCRIPRLVHFVYLSPHLPIKQPPVPDKVMRSVKRWREVNPGWEVRLWNNAMVRNHYPDLAHLMSAVTTMAWVADMVRYHILQQFGGIYVDTDFVPFRPVEQGLCQLGNFIVCQAPRPEISPDDNNTAVILMDRKVCRVAINAVMGFQPNHPAVNTMVHVSLANTRKALAQNSNAKFDIRYTGPGVWTNATLDDPSVSVLHPYTFLPCPYKRGGVGRTCIQMEPKLRKDKRIYAMHEWAKSW